MCDDLVVVGDSRVCVEYPIVILYCKTCNTAHQKFQIPKRELFPSTYHYRSRFTNDVLSGMKNLVDEHEERFGAVKEKKVLDIGCNDGSLLDMFKQRGALTFGVEPTGAFADALEKGHGTLNKFFNVDTAREIVEGYGNPDIVTFTNVFAHIEDLNEVIQALKIVSNDSTLIVVENHYLGAVIEKNQFDTFYHEHPRTYSYGSFVHIAKSLGMDIVDVQFPSRYGGNIRVTIGDSARYGKQNTQFDAVTAKENGFFDDLSRMKDFVADWKAKMRPLLKKLSDKHGPLSAKAFPGRAAILVKLLSLDTDTICETFEKPGSMKIGHYIPGTRIPIRSDVEMMAEIERTPVIVNLAWHIKNEVDSYLRERGFKGDVINIL